MGTRKINRNRKTQKSASLTVEASLVLPIFVFAVLFFLYFFQFLFLMDTIQSGITEAGSYISRYEKVAGEKEMSVVAKQVAAKQKFYQYLNKGNINTSCVAGGIYGINVGISEGIDGQQEIEITATYQVQFPIPFWGEKTSYVTQKVKTRAFVGLAMKKQVGRSDEAGEEEGVPEDIRVYITENGIVYHRSETCTHLKLSISGICTGQIENARNEKGARYKPCEKCVKKGKTENEVYIARDGDCYHNSLTCSGLKRTIYCVSLSEVVGKRKCSRCG